jgi:hypothetical protein
MKNDKFEYKKIVFLEKESFDVSQKWTAHSCLKPDVKSHRTFKF